MKSALLVPTVIAGFGALLFGYDITVSRTAIPLLTSELHLNAVMQGRIIISSLIGCILGSFLLGRRADFYGRRTILMILAILFAISAIGSGVVSSLPPLLVFRAISGISVGGLSVVSLVYLSEISPPHLRGRLVATFQLEIVAGIFLAGFSDFLTMNTGANNWRYMFMGGAIPAIVFVLLLFFIPESPRWLMQKGQERVSRFIIRQLNPELDRDQFIQEIKGSINLEIMAAHAYLFKQPYLKVVLIGVVIGIFNQFTGINTILYYPSDIFTSIGFPGNANYIQVMIIGLTFLVFTIVAMSFIDKVGRKRLLMVGSIGMAASLSLLAILNFSGLQASYILPVILIGYTGFYIVTLGTVFWVLISELFPYNIRTRGISLGLSSLWLSNIFIYYFFPVIEMDLGIGTIYAFFAVATFGSYFFFRKYLFETKGKSLEELERNLMKKKSEFRES